MLLHIQSSTMRKVAVYFNFFEINQVEECLALNRSIGLLDVHKFLILLSEHLDKTIKKVIEIGIGYRWAFLCKNFALN